MKKNILLTDGPIYKTLLHFSVPVILSLLLQSLYGGVDLLVVGRFGTTADVSAVATGSHLMHVVTQVIASLAVGVTVLVGRKVGEKNPRDAGKAVGAGIVLFAGIAFILTLAVIPVTPVIVRILKAPQKAFAYTVKYIRICFAGFCFIVAYNVLGSVFRGMGDSETPLKTVAIAAFVNIVGDIIFVKYFNMGASGAAVATVISQAISVVFSLVFIKKANLPIEFTAKYIRFYKNIIKTEFKLGFPLALQELLVGISFMVIHAVANSIGIIESAGVGVGEKVCAFIMLVPVAFAQSMTAFVAQNYGAGQHTRASKALKYGILTSICFGVITFYITFFHGNILASVFISDIQITNAAHDYLKAYAVDCLMTPIMFCMVGYFNGYGKTAFVMVQGILSAFLIRLPLAIIFGNFEKTSLFLIGCSTPCATFVQILMCLWMYARLSREFLKPAFSKIALDS